MTLKFSRLLMIIAAVASLTIISCKKDKFDEPNHTTTDPNLATISIRTLRAYFTSGLPITINDDVTISGVVTADDKSGNFYKTIIIQDSTGAIPVLIERSELYTDFPVGRKVYIKCKGLVLGVYNKYLQLGGFVDNSTGQPAVGNIPSNLANTVIVKGPLVTPIEPRVISSFSELNTTTDQSILVKLDPVHFKATDIGKPYADIISQQSLSRKLLDCDSSSLDVRTSNYSKFANENTPSGQVSVIGIYSIYGSTKQLTLREASEIVATTTNCPSVLFFENFSAGSSSLTGWQNYKEAGNKNWFTTTFSGNTLVKASAFGSSDASNIAWLITPSIDLTGYTTKKLSFNLTQGQVAGTTNIDVLISTDYIGSGSPTAANWTSLPFTYPELPTTGTFGNPTNSLINLDAYTGPVYVAFKYTGSGASGGTTTYEVDDVKVVAQ